MLCPCPETLRDAEGACLIHASMAVTHVAAPVPSSGPNADLWSRDEDLNELHRAAVAELCRRSLIEFAKRSWHVLEPTTPLEWNWHLEALCLHVQWQIEGWRARATVEDMIRLGTFTQQNVMFNVPPLTMKSRFVSVVGFAWAWTNNPEMKVLALSSNPDVAVRDATYSRDLVSSDWYQTHFVMTLRPARTRGQWRPGEQWELRKDKDAVTKFGNTAGGERQSKGMLAKITGSKADWIIVDDPHDAQEVYSEVKREAIKSRWDNAISNRGNDLRRVIRTGVMQRVHDQDWAGHVVKGGDWIVVFIPMEFEPSRRCVTPIWADPRTEPGEVLHAARFTPEVLHAQRRKGSLYYAAQFQQQPLGLEGNLFKLKWWRWWRPDGLGAAGRAPRPEGCNDREAVALPKLHWLVISVDAAFKKTDEGSRVSVLCIGGHNADRYILDNDTRAMTFKETVEAILRMKAKFPLALRILVEDKANGPAIIETLQSLIPGVIEVNPEGGKESRAAAVSPAVEAGNVYLPEGAEWLTGDTDFLGELAKFPQGEKDDQVDAFSQALIFMTQGADVSRFLMLAGV